ncbi:Hypothetical predicted protein [Olea europaea subsp. europaea]|uniref:Uncharacterized protein n=1 Tax=Olea europaea subsp. europaea TaxID=158383 RepID=A0A8S0UW60_OLEEU|nr:Hypothetical predicted protein [Olea europaea subsp. europaea]
MDDLDVLARDFGFRPQGKSNPMRSDQADHRPFRSVDDQNRDGLLFNDVFGGPPKYTSSSSSNNNSNNKPSSMSDFDYESIFKSESKVSNSNTGGNKTSTLPVYDKPVYDDDIFDGLPGLKNKLGTSSVRFEDDIFAPIASPSTKSKNQNDFDDLLGNLGGNDKFGENNNSKSSSAKSSSTSRGLDDLLAGFGSGIPASSNRPTSESSRGYIQTDNTTSNVMEDPFVVMESTSTPGSSSGVSTDPLEEIGKLGKSRSARAEASSVSDGVFDDLDPLNGFGKPVHPFSPGRDNGGKDGSPSRSGTSVSSGVREQKGKSDRYSGSNVEKKVPFDNFQEPPLFDVPDISSYSHKSFDQTSPPSYYETSSQVDASQSVEEQGRQSDDVWLTVSEIPLFTQPTSAPPPSRPPPPIPRRTSKSETGSFSSNLRKRDDEFSSPRSYDQYSPSPNLAQPAAKSPPVSQLEELDDFAMGRSHFSVDESANFHASEEYNVTSAAAASAAAMKEAMDKAEAKFRHAKEVRGREYAKAARSKESMHLEKDDQQDALEREFRENQEKLERERKQAEEEEREQRRLERERERAKQIERERARQAVERATREARERAAAEAHSKAERVAVEKANAEARERAERAAVQRAQAEARERAAAEARERAEKAAAEARERSASEAREKEAREKAAVARAEAEARRRSERAAVERVAAEARERAAAEAREKASAAAKMSQQKNDNDLESFFGMGSRASSVPRARTDSVDPLFNQQFQEKAGSEAAKRTSFSSGASNMRKASSTTNIVDDLSSIFGAAESSGAFQEVEGETEERRRARLERHQRTQERTAKALAEKNQRDLQAQRDQEERHRIAETLDIEIKRWAAGKEGNLRALLSTMQYVLWPECGWQPVSLTDLITGASVKKVYRKATLCIHPDKVQQKGATLQQKYIAEKVFDLLKEAWNKFNSEELF